MRDISIYYIFSVLTIGIYVFFAKKLVAQLQEIPRIPLSGLFVKGPNFVVTGLQRLLQNDLLRQEEVGEGEKVTTIFFPNSKLISRIMEVQKVVPVV